MARAFVQWPPVEMAVLGLFEFVFSFLLIVAMLVGGGPLLASGSGGLTRDCLLLSAMLAVTLAGVAATIGLYRPDVCLDPRRLLVPCLAAALLAFPAILLVSGAYRIALGVDHIVWLARLLAIWLMGAMALRFALCMAARWMPVTRRVAIVGVADRVEALRRRLSARPHGLFEPVPAAAGLVPPGGPQTVRDARVWGVVIAGEEGLSPPDRAALLARKSLGTPVFTELAFQERHLGRVALDAIDETWFLTADGFRDSTVSRVVKRVFDVGFSLFLLVLTLPLMAVTALAIRLDSPGPVFYRQVRTGLFGASFTLFKFRSMAVDAEAAGAPQWARVRDPRITRSGAFIRATRIDELPQLINVLRGEMSLIGPRPERPMFVAELSQAIPFYNHRERVKPGLTGWAQVNYPYGASVEDAREKLAYDLYYVKNRGVLLDLVILFSTVRVILFREGAR